MLTYIANGITNVPTQPRRAAEHHVPVAGHVPIAELVPAEARVQPGASLKSRSLAWNYVDTSRIDRLVQTTVRSNTWNCPTLSVTRELLAPPERWAQLAKRPENRYLSPQADRSQIPYLKDFLPDDYREVQNGVGAQRQLVGALFRGGAGLLTGTDSYLQGFALQNELEELVKSGIRPWDVLMIATVNAARYLGEQGQWGEVAPGEFADLQLVDANPLLSLVALKQRSGVMVRGRWYPRAAIAGRLTQVAATYRNRHTYR